MLIVKPHSPPPPLYILLPWTTDPALLVTSAHFQALDGPPIPVVMQQEEHRPSPGIGWPRAPHTQTHPVLKPPPELGVTIDGGTQS